MARLAVERDGWQERRIVGILRCVDSPSSPLLLPERYCYVSSVYVVPSERRRGVLRALVAAAERWCDERGIDEMRLHNASSSHVAAAVWGALGFEVVEQVRRRVRAHDRRTSRRRTPGALMPVITVSRMFGSGGSEVAERVADAFGWSLFDNAMVDAIAERSGLTRAEVTAQDERVPSMVERLAAALSFGSPEIMPPVPSGPIETTEERIVAVTRRVIEEAVQIGPAVFVGRGAQCLLAERSDALHVFCYAPRGALRRYVDGEVRRRRRRSRPSRRRSRTSSASST